MDDTLDLAGLIQVSTFHCRARSLDEAAYSQTRNSCLANKIYCTILVEATYDQDSKPFCYLGHKYHLESSLGGGFICLSLYLRQMVNMLGPKNSAQRFQVSRSACIIKKLQQVTVNNNQCFSLTSSACPAPHRSPRGAQTS